MNNIKLIDANELLDRLRKMIAVPTIYTDQQHLVFYKIREAIESAPIIDTVKHGHWVYDYDDEQGIAYHCSYCDEWVFNNKGFMFCPHCGAKMDAQWR